MPGFGPDARQYALIRAEESEPGRMGFQPFGQRRVRSARRELLGVKLRMVSRRGRAPVDQIDIRSPVVAARSGQSRPQQYGVDALPWRQFAYVEEPAGSIQHRPLAR